METWESFEKKYNREARAFLETLDDGDYLLVAKGGARVYCWERDGGKFLFSLCLGNPDDRVYFESIECNLMGLRRAKVNIAGHPDYYLPGTDPDLDEDQEPEEGLSEEDLRTWREAVNESVLVDLMDSFWAAEADAE